MVIDADHFTHQGSRIRCIIFPPIALDSKVLSDDMSEPAKLSQQIGGFRASVELRVVGSPIRKLHPRKSSYRTCLKRIYGHHILVTPLQTGPERGCVHFAQIAAVQLVRAGC